jgi:hypothetical protein
MFLYSLPGIPTTHLFNLLAVVIILHFPPLQDRFVKQFSKTRNVKYVSKSNRRSGAIGVDVRRCKHSYDGYTVGDEGQVDKVSIGHNVVCPPR